MTYEYKDLINHPDLYKVLGTGDVLAKYSKMLNKLTDEQKELLAIALVIQCPEEERKTLRLAIGALLPNSADSFYTTISAALSVKECLISALDYRNPHPHNFLLTEFNPDSFNRFQAVALDTLKNHESLLAEKLALMQLNNADRVQLAYNANILFPDSFFVKKLNAAFTLRRNIEQLLLGDNPESFFYDSDFSIGICTDFSLLFDLIKDKEQTVAAKLCAIDHAETRKLIIHNLGLLTTTPHDNALPLKHILDAMNNRKTSNSYTLFGAVGNTPPESPCTPTTTVGL